MNILGVSGAFGHDPSAALLVDGRLAAAAEEERFVRIKHAHAIPASEAISFCIRAAGLSPEEIDLVAYPYSEETFSRARPLYARRILYHDPIKAARMYTEGWKKNRKKREYLNRSLSGAGIDPEGVEITFVDHHMAHASSAFHFSGWPEAGILSIDGAGEFIATLIARGNPDGSIERIREFIEPDSLGEFYSAFTEFLGFQPNDGEFKVMGMAPYGDPERYDLSDLLTFSDGEYRVADGYFWVPPYNRYKGYSFSRKLVDRFGPPRTNESADEPYIHIAASVQKRFEEAVLHLVEHHLLPVIEETGRLCLAGGCALNVKMNRMLLAHPAIREIFVQPAANDAGTAPGAAALAAVSRGERIAPLEDLYLGPSFSSEEIERTLARFEFPWGRSDDVIGDAADLLASGKVVAWFQGRQEFGPRALGNRSILADPSVPGMADEINARIKYREKWRPFCPSILPEYADEILGTTHPAPFMILAFEASERWAGRMKEAVHVDGTVRPQVVSKEANPRYYALLSAFHARTGIPALINTSLNRRGEPIVTSPGDALRMFKGSALEYIVLGDYIARKE